MNKNIRPISKYTITSLVIILIILLLIKCPGDKVPSSTSTYSVQSVAENTEQMQVDDKKKVLESVENEDEGFKSISPQVKKAKKPVVQKVKSAKLRQYEVQAANSTQTNEAMAELKVLAKKVRILEEKVKLIFEKLKTFRSEMKSKALVETRENSDNEMQADSVELFKYPLHVFAVGASTYKGWTGYGFQGSYAYRASNYFSFGLQLNTFLKEGKYMGDRSIYAGGRTNFHVFPLLVENSRFDLYVGASAGVLRDESVSKFEVMGYMGASYDFNKYWGVFAEAGNIGVLGLRLNF